MSVWFKDKVTKVWKRAAQNQLFPSEPVGAITAYGGDTAPARYMLCNGQALTQAEYPDLYAVIGTKFGVGDGSEGSFNLPDLRGEFLRGAGTNSHSGQGSGGSVGTHQDASEIGELYSHTGGLQAPAINQGSVTGADSNVRESVRVNNFAPNATTGATTWTTKFTTRPTNTSVNYIIKVIK